MGGGGGGAEGGTGIQDLLGKEVIGGKKTLLGPAEKQLLR